MTWTKLFFNSAVLFLLCIVPVKGQEKAAANFENHFFRLDFEQAGINFEDVQKYFFTTFPHSDPTRGDVVYDRAKWQNDEILSLKERDGLYGYLRKRSEDRLFDSFRLTTKNFYNLNDSVKSILFVFKGTLPFGKAIWPAIWLTGSYQDEWLYKGLPDSLINDASLDKFSGTGNVHATPSLVNITDWPAGGEIDIVEMINGEKMVHNTLHTCSQACDAIWNDLPKINCANANASDPNPGCSGTPYRIDSPSGTFACILSKDSISFYYWSLSEDVRTEGGPLSGNPQPKLWTEKNLMNTAHLFNGSIDCTSELYYDWQCENCEGINKCEFKNLKMILNATLCGIWAGKKFDASDSPAQNCKDYINVDGANSIDSQFMKIQYLSIVNLKKTN